eukprot:g2189.t1
MWENAELLGALLVFGEHRYYGETLPFGPIENVSNSDLKYLSVEQALADHAALVAHVKASVPGASDSKVVAIGGSYGGMQSSWARMKYPDTFDGAIAGSAPILAFDNASKGNTAKRAGPFSYWKIVTDDATEAFGSAPRCASNVRNSWEAMDRLFATGESGRRKIRDRLSLCEPPRSDSDLFAIKVYMQMAFDSMAMGNFPFPSSYLANGVAVLPAFPFRAACDYLAGDFADNDEALVEALGHAAAVFNNASKQVLCFEPPTDAEYDGIWDYLWCTETLCQETYFGRNGVDDMFWPLAYSENGVNAHCKAKYNVTPSYDKIADEFKGLAGVRNSSNIVFSNGRFDPWRSGGVTSVNDSARSLWSIEITNGAHHVDLMFRTDADTEDITRARAFELEKIKEWIAHDHGERGAEDISNRGEAPIESRNNSGGIGSNSDGSTPLFVTFDSAIDPRAIDPSVSPFLSQIKFVWGSSGSERMSAWRVASPTTELSYYMPYSRAPAASRGYSLSFWKENHPDWILYRCDRKSVAFWDGESGETGSVPLDFTNTDVITWQVNNQSALAYSLGYDSMAFDNFGGGARAGANPGQACGVFDKSGEWHYRFGQTGNVFNNTASIPSMKMWSVEWIERISGQMMSVTPGLGIVPNLCVDNAGWVDSDDAKRVADSVTGVLSERGFTGWGTGPVEEKELLDEYRWMDTLSESGKSYYSINEIKEEDFSEAWMEWVLGAFYVGQTPGAALWIGTVQGYGNFSYQPQETAARLGAPTSARYRTGDGSILLRRNFTGGVVILNPTEAEATAFVESGLSDLKGVRVPSGSMRFDAQAARVLVRSGVAR